MAASFFKDKHGKVVITQPPNLPIIGWLVLTIANFFIRSTLLGWAASALLAVWAFMELALGVNYFRRLLGLVVLIAVILAHLFKT